MDILVGRRSVLLVRARNATRAVAPENMFIESERLTASCLFQSRTDQIDLYTVQSTLFIFLFRHHSIAS
jgi:hypothetical protein